MDSIVGQTLSQIEIILIDDGSTDKSLKICQKYAKEDVRIKLIKKTNTGYGDSLNQALKIAEGEYIGIVEPDDFIAPNMYEALYDKAKDYKTDIVKASYYDYYDGKAPVAARLFPRGESGRVLNPKKDQSVFLVDPTIWSAIYHREMLEKNNVSFLPTPGASYQDAGFAFKTFAAAASVYCTNTPYYYYRRDNSNSSVKSTEKITAVKTEFDGIDDFLRARHQYKDLYRISAICRFRSYLWNLNRLPSNKAIQFAETIKQDYESISRATGFSTEDFKGLEREDELKLSIENPELYINLRPLFSIKNKSLQTLSKIYHAIK